MSSTHRQVFIRTRKVVLEMLRMKKKADEAKTEVKAEAEPMAVSDGGDAGVATGGSATAPSSSSSAEPAEERITDIGRGGEAKKRQGGRRRTPGELRIQKGS